MDDAPGVLSSDAEVRRTAGAGLDIALARHLRIRLRDGDVVLERPGRPPRRVCSVADASRALWLPPATTAELLLSRRERAAHRVGSGTATRVAREHGGDALAGLVRADGPGTAGSGAVVLLRGEDPVLCWLVDDMTPGGGDADERLRTSGSAALVRALGLVIEPVTGDPGLTAGHLRDVQVPRTAVSPAASALAPAALLLSGVLAFFAWPLPGLDGRTWFAAAALLVGLPPALLLARDRSRLLGLVRRPPAPAGRHVVRPVRALAEHTGDTGDTAQLQLGPRDVVVVTGRGEEVWLKGPELGGVTTAVGSDKDLQLRDRDGRQLLALTTRDLAPDDAAWRDLAERFGSNGVEASWHPVPLATAQQPWRLSGEVDPFAVSARLDGDGGLVTGSLATLAPLVTVVASLGVLEDSRPAGLLVLLLALAWSTLRAWSVLSLRRWTRSRAGTPAHHDITAPAAGPPTTGPEGDR